MKLVEPIVAWQHEIAAIRRDLHAHPEIAYEEHRTSELIAAKLAEWGIPTVRGLAGTGVVGIVKGGDNPRAIGLRADIDALPMQEANTFGHASKTPGKMHGCGHDGHTAMLLAAAKHFSQHRNFDGTVYLIFQPAEENGGGADRMIKDGLFDKCPMDAVFGMHNWPGIPVGKFAVTAGPIMASTNEFFIKLQGRGGHAAMPQNSADPVYAAVQLHQALQSVITRNNDPIDSAVLSITQINAGSATNVIPNEAELRGTVRTFTTDTVNLIERRMREISTHIAAAFDMQLDFRFVRGYPPTVNHEAETAFAVDVMRDIVGHDNVDAQVRPSMGGEDFSYMLLQRPGTYIWAGNGTGDHREAGHGAGPCMLHNGSYDFNDDLIPVGATYWVRVAESWFERYGKG